MLAESLRSSKAGYESKLLTDRAKSLHFKISGRDARVKIGMDDASPEEGSNTGIEDI